jgi:copper chaperone CopZ
MKTNKNLGVTVLLTALSTSLCCITPVLALIAGTSGLASTFSWLTPFRPYLIGLTLLVLAFAWFQKLKPQMTDKDCCDAADKPKFVSSKKFLGIVTVLAIGLLAFPYYASAFFPKQNNSGKQIIIVDKANIQTFQGKIKDIECKACELHIKQEVNKLPGILQCDVSYENSNAVIEFDSSKVSAQQIKSVINSTGYPATEIKIKTQ